MINDQVKICTRCNEEKPLNEFYFRKKEQRYTSICKKCIIKRSKKYTEEHKEERLKYHKNYRDNHAEEIKLYNETHRKEQREKAKIYYLENKEAIQERKKRYYQNNRDKEIQKALKYFHSNKEERHQYNKEYRESHKEELAERRRRDREDIIFKMKDQVRNLIGDSFRRRGFTKRSHTYEIVGVEWEEFYKHLLKTYKDNYGYEWDGIEEVHIDHIIPLATATTEEEVIKLCYYTNLQLLKAKDNLIKNASLDYKLPNKTDNKGA